MVQVNFRTSKVSKAQKHSKQMLFKKKKKEKQEEKRKSSSMHCIILIATTDFFFFKMSMSMFINGGYAIHPVEGTQVIL